MPEGDTIHKVAGYFAPRLQGRTLAGVRLPDEAAARWCTGRRVTAVTARGKHLFIELDGERALRSHLGMHGTWHRYAPGERWQKPARQAAIVLEVGTTGEPATAGCETGNDRIGEHAPGGDIYVCFNAKEVELVRLPAVRARIVHGRLGPDLIADAVDYDALVRRAREFLEPDTLIADVLLDQRVAAGIGNVYKSEVLFIERLLPATPLADVDDLALARCYRTAAGLLRQNLGGGPRVTRFENDDAGRCWVYGRTGLPCLRCDGTIASARLGKHHRSTYWCPTCQL